MIIIFPHITLAGGPRGELRLVGAVVTESPSVVSSRSVAVPFVVTGTSEETAFEDFVDVGRVLEGNEGNSMAAVELGAFLIGFSVVSNLSL